MDQRAHIQLFGGLKVQVGERSVTRFRTQKTGALLAFLAYHLGNSVSRETLIEMLWPDSEPESGRHSLSLALSSLRNQLEPPGVLSGSVILADRFTVELNPEAVSTDVREFEQALRSAAQARNSPSHVALLDQAVEQYLGPLLPGFYEDWIAPEQERLGQRYIQAAIQLIAGLERAGDLERALETARRATALDPTREDVAREFMRLLAASGQFEAALRYFSEIERVFEADLGDEPSTATQQLAQEIRARSIPVTFTAPEQVVRKTQDPSALNPPIPTGTVTFLMTDIEGSTALWEKAGAAFKSALSTHHALIRREIGRNGGYEANEAGDSFLIAFATASDALSCALACQRGLAAQPWPTLQSDGPDAGVSQPSTLNPQLKVRMALHTGEVELENGEYHGIVLHRGSRILSAAHGGQTLVSEATAALLRRDLETDLQLKDLGVYRLRDVETPERLIQVCYSDMAAREFPPPDAEPANAARLPMQFTRFFGREQEIERLESALRDTPGTRLITLTGPGGTGKTRLAIEVAGRAADSFPGSVAFVPIADLSDGRLVAGAILEALGIPRSPVADAETQAAEALSKDRSLLILDNFEQVVADGAEVILKLLERAPQLVCLVTSRQILGLEGEREFVVPPLSTPNTENATPDSLSLYDSVRLFVDRAQAVKPDFQVTNSNAHAVAELCDRLEGIPLALELAAARALVMTPSQMLAQLSRRFEFLVSRRRGVAERQRTLRAAVDWSFRLLSPQLQEFFTDLSVFRGGWTVEAAEVVCDEPLAIDYLAQLRDCSLVLTEDTLHGIRFRMMETLRDYAGERLSPDDQKTAVKRHTDYYLELAVCSETALLGPDQQEWLDRLELEQANFRSALERCGAYEENLAAGLKMAGALSRFWSIRGHSREGRRLAEMLLDRAKSSQSDGPDVSDRSPAIAMALDAAGSMAHDMGDFGPAAAYLETSLTMWREIDDKRRIANSLNLLANVLLDRGDEEAARPLYEEALSLFGEVEDRRGTGMVLGNQAVAAMERNDIKSAAGLMDESLRLKRQSGNQHSLAIALENLGNIRMKLNEPEAARDLHAEALSIRRQIGHKQGIAMSLNNLGHTLLDLGDLDSAANHLTESITLFHELGDSRGLAEALEGAAGVLFALGRHEPAANLLGASLALSGATAMSDALSAARESLGEKKFEKALAAGRAWSYEEVEAYAKALLTAD